MANRKLRGLHCKDKELLKQAARPEAGAVPASLKAVCKSNASVPTTINQTQKENLRKFYKGKKYKPRNLLPKKTRATAHQLHKQEESLQSREQLDPLQSTHGLSTSSSRT
ncbi:unnamed protein product [Nyctereutes procyonoides]|uniref:Large ribosomal subunit protein uL29 n=1 Tax=Nyctereutes procyonoides TaxID=34880 RepID=A0A811YSU5_NYCPR|nr:unnamed protein product [Nyctereutes procyonoides]CAD7688164.1 unnamed protein product [Nyctereutes procyonoides]